MKKYLSIAALFLFNNEIISWIVLLTLTVIAFVDVCKSIDAERERKWLENERE